MTEGAKSEPTDQNNGNTGRGGGGYETTARGINDQLANVAHAVIRGTGGTAVTMGLERTTATITATGKASHSREGLCCSVDVLTRTPHAFRDGSYYYSNPDKSTYYNNGDGYARYTAPGGSTHHNIGKGWKS
ncbi:MAG: hypothetical protein M1821_005139 [Bathelium mastoideum]|nr:MAG: hypothetical protein M1821_005139 [Bathelium mastoideum]